MEDVISRQAAIGIIQNWLNTDGYSCGERNVMKCAIEELKDLPSVSTEKTGHWKWNQYDYNPNLGNWHCSECGSIAIECVPKKGPSGVPLYKYCPQCGCRLMGVEE